MNFDHPEHEASFELPDKWTIRQVLDYDSVLHQLGDSSMYVRLWCSAQQVVENWESETVDIQQSLDEVSGQEAVEIIEWSSRAVFSARLAMNGDQKN